MLIFVLTSAVNDRRDGADPDMPMWLGLLPGSRNPLLTLLPAVAAIATIAGTIALAAWARRGAARPWSTHAGGMYVALIPLSGGVVDHWR